MTHYLGNDDYDGTEETDRLSQEEAEVDGHEALGNGLTEEDLEAVDETGLSSGIGVSSGKSTAAPKSDNIYDASI